MGGGAAGMDLTNISPRQKKPVPYQFS